jgi:hypothetical protein
MSRALRRRHFRSWLIIGPVAIVILIVALLSKPVRPVQPSPAPGTEAGP